MNRIFVDIALEAVDFIAKLLLEKYNNDGEVPRINQAQLMTHVINHLIDENPQLNKKS